MTDFFACRFCSTGQHAKCPTSGKWSYRSKAAARDHRRQINSYNQGSTQLHNEYLCKCGSWHTTSMRKPK